MARPPRCAAAAAAAGGGHVTREHLPVTRPCTACSLSRNIETTAGNGNSCSVTCTLIAGC